MHRQGQNSAHIVVDELAQLSYLEFISVSKEDRYESACAQEGLLELELAIFLKGNF